jgi:dTMP kinase
MLGINSFAVDRAVPDLTLLLDIDVAVGLKRVGRRRGDGSPGKDTIEREDTSFHERVRAGYLELASRFPDRIKVIDATRAEDSVAEEIWMHVQRVADTDAGQGGTG